MSIIGWIIVGLVVGVIAGKIAGVIGQELAFGVVIGIWNAVFCGALFSLGSGMSVTSFNIVGMIVAALGTSIMLKVYYQSPKQPLKSNPEERFYSDFVYKAKGDIIDQPVDSIDFTFEPTQASPRASLTTASRQGTTKTTLQGW